MKILISLSKADSGEVFTFFNMRFYPGAMTKAIESGKLKPRFEDVDISQWAKDVLGLRLGDKTHKPASFLMRIDYDHSDKISADRLKEHIYIVETKMGGIFIDGNHRVANAYRNGITKLPAYIISQAQAKKHGIMR